VRHWSVKFWKPARRIAGLAGETLHGTLLVRSIVEFTYKFKGCTTSGLVGSIGASSLSPSDDRSVLSDAGRPLEADDTSAGSDVPWQTGKPFWSNVVPAPDCGRRLYTTAGQVVRPVVAGAISRRESLWRRRRASIANLTGQTAPS
jgi:hypothetical protein